MPIDGKEGRTERQTEKHDEENSSLFFATFRKRLKRKKKGIRFLKFSVAMEAHVLKSQLCNINSLVANGW